MDPQQVNPLSHGPSQGVAQFKGCLDTMKRNSLLAKKELPYSTLQEL